MKRHSQALPETHIFLNSNTFSNDLLKEFVPLSSHFSSLLVGQCAHITLLSQNLV